MNIDATPSLKLWAVTVRLGGRAYRIPPHPAARWLAAIGAANLARIVPGMLEEPDEGDDILDSILAGDLSADEWQEAAREAIGAISGMKWWSAARLTHYLLDNWGTLGGAVIARGLDPSTAPLGAVLTLTYRILLENCKGESERQKLDNELDRPPTGVPVSQIYDPKQAEANFMALASAPS